MTELQTDTEKSSGPGERVQIHDMHVVDPFKDSDGNFARITAELEQREAQGYYGDSSINLDRKRPGTIDVNNPATRWMYEQLPGFAEWHSLVPTAAALEPLYDPTITTLSNGKEFTPDMRAWMSNIYDAIGIRSRAQVMESVVVGEALRNMGEKQRWVSLGCGAAQPVIAALTKVREYGALVPDVTLVDYQQQALSRAMQGAEAAGFGDAVTKRRMNILKPDGIAGRRDKNDGFHRSTLLSMGKLPAESFDMVDAVGILEYLKPEDWKYTYGGVISTKKGMAGAVRFLHNAYELVKPGGQLIVGNMRETHPQLGFTLNTIQWPHIQPRSIEQITALIKDAGLEGSVDVYCPDDAVYAIYVIRKDL